MPRPPQWIASLRPGRTDWAQMMEATGRLYTLGADINWTGLHEGYARRRTPAPTYPFQKQRYWIDPPRGDAAQPLELHPILGRRLKLPGSGEVRFETRFCEASPPYVPDHRVFGVLVVAGASHVAMILQGASEAFGREGWSVEELFFQSPFALADGGSRLAQLVFAPEREGAYTLELTSLDDGKDGFEDAAWVTHVRGRIETKSGRLSERNATGHSATGRSATGHGGTGRGATGRGASIETPPIDVEAIRARCREEVAGADFYESYWVQGPDAGPSFRWIETLWKGDGEAIASTVAPELGDDLSGYRLHPGLIEACFQVMRGGRDFESQALLAEGGDIFVPFAIETIRFYGQPADDRLWCHAKLREGDDDRSQRYVADLVIADAQGRPVAEIVGFDVRRLPQETLARRLAPGSESWLHEVVWRDSGAAPGEAQPGHWLIVASGDDEHQQTAPAETAFAERLEAWVAERGGAARVVRVYAGSSARNGTDVSSQIAKLVGDTDRLDGIVSLIGLDAPSEFDAGQLDPDRLAANQARALDTGLNLIAAVARLDRETAPRIVFATRGAQAAGDHPLDLAQAPLVGLTRVAAWEHPEIDTRVVDLAPGSGEDDLAALAGEISSDDGEPEVAYRGGRRLVARLQHAGEPAASDAVFSARPDAAYLVTGGLGGLGLCAAQWLAQSGARSVALMGRRPPSAEAEAAIAKLRDGGVAVEVVAADVANLGEVEQAIARIRSALAPLAGVIHAAGVLDDGIILQQTPERFAAVMAPKVAGTLNLDQATRDLDLDFFVCFSSASALVGAPGQANYAAANAFLDAYAEHRRHEGRPMTSVDWGPWAEVGMAASLGERDRERARALGWDAIAPDEGFAILGRLISQGRATTGVLPLDWEAFAAALPGAAGRKRYHEVVPRIAHPGTAHPAPARAADARQSLADEVAKAPALERRARLETLVAREVSGLLGLSGSGPLDPRAGFADMGMDSLMSIELRSQLQSGFGIRLPSTFAFDYSNVEDVAGYLLGVLFGEEAGNQSEKVGEGDGEPAPLEDDDLDATIAAELAELEARLDCER